MIILNLWIVKFDSFFWSTKHSWSYVCFNSWTWLIQKVFIVKRGIVVALLLLIIIIYRHSWYVGVVVIEILFLFKTSDCSFKWIYCLGIDLFSFSCWFRWITLRTTWLTTSWRFVTRFIYWCFYLFYLLIWSL